MSTSRTNRRCQAAFQGGAAAGMRIGVARTEVRGSGGARRGGSALVLVMTLLGILFVLGVAFMASMNFEAEMVAADSQRDDGMSVVESMTEMAGAMLGSKIMSGPGIPFGATSVASIGGTFAELPGVHGSFSPVEPTLDPGPDGILVNGDDVLYFAGHTNPLAMKTAADFTNAGLVPPAITQLPVNFFVPTTCPPGFRLGSNPMCPVPTTCSGGPNDGMPCLSNNDCGGTPCMGMQLYCDGGTNDGGLCTTSDDCDNWPCGPMVLDADGDGISDSVAVDVKHLGYTESELATLARRLNAPSKPRGRVYVGIRVVPHGGMVDVNSAHPKLIETALDVPDLRQAAGPDYGYFRHGPSGPARGEDPYTYLPASEERLLRRRNLLPSQYDRANPVAASRLLGNPFASRGNPEFEADMGWRLFVPWPGEAAAGNYQTVLNNRYRPFRFHVDGGNIEKERFKVESNKLDVPAWDAHIEPFSSQRAEGSLDQNEFPAYDRRHIVTTVSHDDLLHRGGRVGLEVGGTTYHSTMSAEGDILAMMSAANYAVYDPNDCDPRNNYPENRGVEVENTSARWTLPNASLRLLPFEYPDYPETIPDDCCPTDPSCRLNPRKGRLQLSLPWLEEQLKLAATGTGLTRLQKAEIVAKAQRVIYDAFMMLVRNAMSSPYFSDSCANGIPCAPGEYCEAGSNICRDIMTNQRHSVNQLTRMAASLTANFLDFADADDEPTRIALRNFDFQATCQGGLRAGQPCSHSAWSGQPSRDCPPSNECNSAIPPGREIDANAGPSVELHYVYGIEKQPFITEVATYYDGNNGEKGWAVEVYNPFDNISTGDDEYYLYQSTPSGTGSILKPPILLLGKAGRWNSGFTVFITASAGIRQQMLPNPPKGTIVDLAGSNSLSFENGDYLYLVRRHRYHGDPVDSNIVIDQFRVEDADIAQFNPPPTCAENPPRICHFSIERDVEEPTALRPNVHWKCTVDYHLPERDVNATNDSGLGTWAKQASKAELRPVEIFLSNSGVLAYSGPLRYDAQTIPPSPIYPAYPTTGTMLLLLRHANRNIDDFDGVGGRNVYDLAFSRRLAEEPQTPHIVTGVQPFAVPEWKQIDNGRLPIFDAGAYDFTTVPLTRYTMHHARPADTPLGQPGELSALPWGQLVFDYFTTLPLSNPGPYVNNPDDNSNPESRPMVDLDGLRVHGRININAAPWKVIAGIPLIPMQFFPDDPDASLKTRLKAALGMPAAFDDREAYALGRELAQAIVAYRDLQYLPGTGDYRDGDGDATGVSQFPPNAGLFGRGWSLADPQVRRGTGFLSVGELANVRHTQSYVKNPAQPDLRNRSNYPYRIDGGNVGYDQGGAQVIGGTDYLSAVATLVALSDWVTVRSQVFTVYGVLRGEDDPDIANDPANASKSIAEKQYLQSLDANSRAIRFQETIDRLWMLLGEPQPRRIGERVVAPYADFRSD